MNSSQTLRSDPREGLGRQGAGALEMGRQGEGLHNSAAQWDLLA